MAAHLKKCGWEYVVVDIRWYVENDKAHGYNEKDPIIAIDKYGRLVPAVNRFPSSAGGRGFKPLADYIHSRGLRFGIHVMRGIPKLAVEKNTPVLGSTATGKGYLQDPKIYALGWAICTVWTQPNRARRDITIHCSDSIFVGDRFC